MHDERKRYGEGKEKLVERGWVRQPCAKDGWQNGGISFYYAWSLGFPLRFEELAYRSSKKRDIRRRNESLPGSLIVDFDERFYARYVFSPSLLSWPDPSSQPSYKSYQLPFRRFDLSSFDGRRYESSVPSILSPSISFATAVKFVSLKRCREQNSSIGNSIQKIVEFQNHSFVVISL